MSTSPASELKLTPTIDADGLHYRELNARLRDLVDGGATDLVLQRVCGQRYIGTGVSGRPNVEIYGTPGNDLGAFMDGPRIVVHGNAQDGCGNTMNDGEIVIHGRAGDIVGLSARGGSIFIRDEVGYRVGIHMKEYQDKRPIIVIGGTAQDFAGEYMAGGVLMLLGLNLAAGEKHRASFVGTGMHGGVIYLRGDIDDFRLGKEVAIATPDGDDMETIARYVAEFAAHFGVDAATIMARPFLKLYPRWLRPYGNLYA